MGAFATETKWPNQLVEWYTRHRRILPWRETPNPYWIWISEMMLQQTQMDTVLPYFERFIAQFPSIESLANADLQQVLKAWEGLGYYSRARNFHKAANKVANFYQGKLPTTAKELETLPGIGPYIAAAIASTAFGEAVPVVDGNVLRVFTRFWAITNDIAQPKTRQTLFNQLTPAIQTVDPSAFNQGMMELGALICRPASPSCHQCPIQTHCKAYQLGSIDQFPVKSKKQPVPHYTIAVAIIWKNGSFLIAKRKTTQMLGGLWEFPGGKVTETESLQDAVYREVLEETGLTVKVGNCFKTVAHAYTHFKISMHAFHCEWVSGQAHPLSSDEVRWIPPNEAQLYPFPTANKKVLEALQSESQLGLF